MRKGSSLRAIRMIKPDPLATSVLFLAICFFLGGLLGYLYAGSCDVTAKTAFRCYLSDYCLWFERTNTSVSLGRCLALYFSGVCVSFLFGFSSLGVVVLPLLSASFGFLSFYTVSCFVLSFGKNAILLAAALTLTRLIFTTPCFFAVSSEALVRSLRAATLTVGQGNKISSPRGRYAFVFVVCVILLCIGVFCERFLTPVLFRAVIGAFEFNP